jgi:hypothetical protein
VRQIEHALLQFAADRGVDRQEDRGDAKDVGLRDVEDEGVGDPTGEYIDKKSCLSRNQ